ncbi:MAG: hypothetical protein Kow00127_16660 [Bacteroidales bacterium]
MDSTNTTQDSWRVIVNPNSGNEKGSKDWPLIAEILRSKGLHFNEVFTSCPGDGIEIARKLYLSGERKFLVVGGDGTLNEVANGILNAAKGPVCEATLGIIPVGTGNDWCRTHKIPNDYEKAADILIKGKTICQDAGMAIFHTENALKERYFVNIAGTGYDGLVAHKTNKDMMLGQNGTLVYLKNLFTSLLAFRSVPVKIQLDDQAEEELTLFSISTESASITEEE